MFISYVFFIFFLGFGLAFMVYPEAVARMPGGPIWSVLWFLTLITLGLDGMVRQHLKSLHISLMCILEGLVNIAYDS